MNDFYFILNFSIYVNPIHIKTRFKLIRFCVLSFQ